MKKIMPAKTKIAKQYTPGSVPVVNQPKIYFSSDIQAAGSMDAFLKSVGSDKAKPLPELDFSEEQWERMLKDEN
ncbi:MULTISPECIES: hypothetical protein [unclassified Spirosoma]|uniref:hypothetical protein n=1 Tax=unclassified Spirosoma TaxID=2621999 RepID=UPI00095DD3AC|nr:MULTISPECIES: hypothetical protein [unclassified Spirosoma]MBN8825020.1 hypothetical protein [Spirosoma sp.]OJW73313.1 MAG: hypothetical protein BGO59_07500 [Spirosoma sp. 48-14]